MTTDRIPCIVSGCGRTAPSDKYPPGCQIICQKHWRMVPANLKHQYKRLSARERKLKRLYAKRGIENPELETLWRQQAQNWREIRQVFHSEKPEGIDAFIEEVGLR